MWPGQGAPLTDSFPLWTCRSPDMARPVMSRPRSLTSGHFAVYVSMCYVSSVLRGPRVGRMCPEGAASPPPPPGPAGSAGTHAVPSGWEACLSPSSPCVLPVAAGLSRLLACVLRPCCPPGLCLLPRMPPAPARLPGLGPRPPLILRDRGVASPQRGRPLPPGLQIPCSYFLSCVNFF